ncbi:MAG: acyl-CoA dehydrogenase family protein [SAR202 cluster bacterium]|nr:acyl-CoA dehydrogenase family protein [SAR202 cluster bacterium]
MLDFYNISSLLKEEERQIQSSVREYLDKEVSPNINTWWESETFPEELIPKFGELGILGTQSYDDTNNPPPSDLAYGLVMYELERIDSGLRSFVSVQRALVAYPINRYGSEEHRNQFLPGLSDGRIVGCFGLTEHQGGSDPGAMQATARKDGNEFVLNGVKMWITNGTIADLAIIWARDDELEVRGFIVPTETDGMTINPVRKKLSFRISSTAELVLDNVRVPASAMLPKASGLSAPLSCLNEARYGIAWGVMGALEAVYIEALKFAAKRETFGQRIDSRQLVQAKLTQMLSDHTRGLLTAWRLGMLKNTGVANFAQFSMAKRENVRAALSAARSARDILGASGITLDYQAMRHMLNLETVDTYEGTYDIHTLVVGREITGQNALG